MRKSIIALVIFSIFALTGCKDPDPCQEQETYGWHLPKVLNEYLPYEVGQQITFVNETGETMSFQAEVVNLLQYDTAYYTSTFNPCYPTGIFPTYGVGLILVPESVNPNGLKKGLFLSFGGMAGGDFGQNVGISFNIVSDLTNHQESGTTYYNGNIQHFGDTVEIQNEKINATIVKGHGLIRFQDSNVEGVWTRQ
ncbi:MAG: hypothetical protein K5636_08055 [Bacteroidales bacterium]|nr:hypothetical protein [Bacteroidales bacterium]